MSSTLRRNLYEAKDLISWYLLRMKIMLIKCYLLNCYIGMSIPYKFLIWIKNLSKVGAKILFFHYTRTLVKLSGRTYLKRNLMHWKSFLKPKIKADKGNTVLILNRKDYFCQMKNTLNGSSKIHKVYIDHDKIWNYLIHMKNRVTDILKTLRDKKEISSEQYKD